ncbi:flagellar basal body rod protein FlgB [bacterium]|nr:flagellar basal body rod protein FlgB [bacterium]
MDATTAVLERVLDMRMKAHEAHVSNIANANVPNFKAKKVEFTKALEEAISQGDVGKTLKSQEEAIRRAALSVAESVYEDPDAPMKSNGNTVNMEREQTELAKNTIGYETAIQLINKKFAMQRYVLSEGAR